MFRELYRLDREQVDYLEMYIHDTFTTIPSLIQHEYIDLILGC